MANLAFQTRKVASFFMWGLIDYELSVNDSHAIRFYLCTLSTFVLQDSISIALLWMEHHCIYPCDLRLHLYIHLRRVLFGDVLVRTLTMKKPIFHFSASHAMKGSPSITSAPMGSLYAGKDHAVPTAAWERAPAWVQRTLSTYLSEQKTKLAVTCWPIISRYYQYLSTFRSNHTNPQDEHFMDVPRRTVMCKDYSYDMALH